MAEAICREIIRRRRRKKRKARGGRWEGEREEDGCQLRAYFESLPFVLEYPAGVWSRENHQERRRTQNLSVDKSLVQLNQQSVTLP